MTQHPLLPPAIRCNRGFGWTFWMVMAIICLFTVIAVVGTRNSGSAGGLDGLGIGAFVAVLFIVVRAVFLPRLDILPAQGTIRTRRRTVPFSAIAVVEFTGHSKSGVWANFLGDDGKCLARMSIAATLFAPPSSEQWAALRHAILSAARTRGASLAQQPVTPGNGLPVGSAISVVDAQTAWCLAGHRSSAGGAPAAALTGVSIAIR